MRPGMVRDKVIDVSTMRFRRLGNSGLVVSAVGLGCNNFGTHLDAREAGEVVTAALDAGVTLFDTADVYGNQGASEQMLGAALKGQRDDVLIATKFGREMGGVNGADDLVRAGKVRYLGHSKFAAWQAVDAHHTAVSRGLTPFVAAENQYNLVQREVEAELLPACRKLGLGLLPYYPLARGLLTGKYRRGTPAPDCTRLAQPKYFAQLTSAPWDAMEALEGFAEERGRSLLDVAIGGLAAQPAVGSVIAGATTPEQVRRNVAAGWWVPSEDDLVALDALLKRYGR
jgi:aryl-alcohol dehydrogenase-like predicted oxidoreductase